MFVIVRHGNTFESGETPRRIGASTDLPLTQAGFDQASALGRYFAAQGWKFSLALTSPLLRTRQTTEAILQEMEKPEKLETADFLREIEHGPDENKPEDAVRDRIGPAALDDWESEARVPPGWIVEPEKRIAAWSELFAGDASRESPVLVVTSNGAARFALMADPDLRAASKCMKTLKLPTGGFGVIERDPEGTLVPAAWGRRP